MRNLILAIILAAIAAAMLVTTIIYFELDSVIRNVVLRDKESLIHFCGLYVALCLGCSAVLRSK